MCPHPVPGGVQREYLEDSPGDECCGGAGGGCSERQRVRAGPFPGPAGTQSAPF